MDSIAASIRLLPGMDEVSDALLDLYMKMVEQRILNYTNQRVMPDGLIYDVFIPMVMELVGKFSKGSADMPIGEISSISEGGSTVSFKSSDTAQVKSFIDSRVLFYTDQLNKYRRLI